MRRSIRPPRACVLWYNGRVHNAEPHTLAEVSRRSRAGWVALALRGGVGKLITLGALVLLSRTLAPADFGVFAILQFPLGLLSLVADAGLHAALVQRTAVSEADEAAGFTLRLLLAVALGALTVLAAGALGALYQLNAPAVWALRLLALGPIINALGTVPGMRLTRQLRFDRLAWAELGSLVAGQGVAVLLALAGAGLFSLAGGALASTVAGTLLVNVLAPWRPQLRLPRDAARALLVFGLPYQAQGLAHLAKDRVIPALGGLLLSGGQVGGQVGLLVWAQDLAHWPRLPADYVARVGFPAFARLQADPAGLAGAVNEAIGLVVLVSGGLSAAALALAPALVAPVFGAEWAGAGLPLQIFLLQTPLDALAAVLLPLVYALGLAGRGLRLSLAWAALTWALCWAAVAVWPHLPSTIANAPLAAIPTASGLGTLAAVLVLLRQLPNTIRLDPWRSLLRPVLIAAAAGVALRVLIEVIL